MPDLTALVLTLAPASPTTTPGHLGRAAYALLLRLIAEVDADLAQALHDTDTRKPLTCTTLLGGERQDKNSRLYVPDKPSWLRFTGLNSAVSAHLCRLAEHPPETVELDGLLFQVQSATVDTAQHPWAGTDSYEPLAAPYLLAAHSPRYHVGLQFASPTTFRSNGRSQPVPMPVWVFGSLLDRWNEFSPVRLPEEVRRFAEACVVLNRYDLRTQAVPLKADVTQMGCVGEASYILLNRDRYWASLLNLLTSYAFYSGVGYQTTVGLGQVRQVP